MRMLAIALGGVLLGALLGALFSREYPDIQGDAGLVTLFAVAGLLLALCIDLLARLARRAGRGADGAERR